MAHNFAGQCGSVPVIINQNAGIFLFQTFLIAEFCDLIHFSASDGVVCDTDKEGGFQRQSMLDSTLEAPLAILPVVLEM